MHVRRPKPERRVRRKAERPLALARVMPARRYRVWPDAARFPHLVVEVRLCRDMRRLRQAYRWSCDPEPKQLVGGGVESWHIVQSGRPVLQRGGVVARLYLNRREVMERWTEVPAHECGHAAMAWARWCRANLAEMPGEEVMCYALGRMTAQLMRVLWAEWGR